MSEQKKCGECDFYGRIKGVCPNTDEEIVYCYPGKPCPDPTSEACKKFEPRDTK